MVLESQKQKVMTGCGIVSDPVAGHDPERFLPTDLVDLKSRASAITLALSDGFGSGNVNARILFRRWEATA
jgi:3-oxoacyl-(acyl-carrier-protein) synthase